jgi:hypothetical protein
MPATHSETRLAASRPRVSSVQRERDSANCKAGGNQSARNGRGSLSAPAP